MPLFEWQDDYSVNIREIDEQHRKLMGMLNKLYDAMRDGLRTAILEQTLDEMVDYSVTHFFTEEWYMKQHGYHGLAAHQREHNAFKQKALELRGRFDVNPHILPVETGKYLKNWWQQHVLGTDKRFGAFLNGRGVT